ncbi:uncharacterized protein CIMG_00095 [Coccidioides immitis RS]|uniref:DUF7730 domain-containing protein n=1 Tax=Coccidioides immitis (strain RS) TaxID=246410 RepID=J3KG95_COCIM|nr:uncharacterized protein CIMG_00095 [Coccidioides immitis RS]EAS34741.3 hypothetical protein CIMG_00095 [Coccidioides immitis RS]
MATQAQSQAQAKALGLASGAADANASGGARTPPLTSTPCLPSATANSALFQRIPPEIRRLILVEAFGESPMHFDLRLLHPLKKHPPKRSGTHGPRHANLDHSARDEFAPRQWQWCSSATNSLTWTTCHLGASSCCDAWPGKMPMKCLIGAMGWLLTCRQAYVEGVEVLYGTNRIRIEGTYLLRRLPDLLLPQRRAAIRSVQLYWNIHPWLDSPGSRKREKYPPGSDMEGFISLLNIFPEVLPNIRFLYLSLQGNLGFPAVDRRGTSEGDEMTINASEELLQLVDQMVVKLHRLSHCHILLPTSYFRALNFRENGIRFTLYNSFSQEPLWRVLPVQNDSQQEEGA